MKILFHLPRLHTNLHQSVAALIERGDIVIAHVSHIGAIEDHSLIKPYLLEQSVVSRLLVKCLGTGRGDKMLVFPSLVGCWLAVSRENPDCIVIRDPHRVSSMMYALCGRIRGHQIVFYTLSRFEAWPRRRYLLARFLNGIFQSSWYSPIMPDVDKLNLDARLTFVPFATEAGDKHKAVGNIERRPVRLLMIGKYRQPRKNHRLFVEMIAAVTSSVEVEGVIVGEADRASGEEAINAIHQTAIRLGIEDRIVMHQNVPFGEMRRLYEAADVFVLPASKEPAGISVLEALASGIPAICSDTCGTQHYIRQGVNGYVFVSDSLDDLVAKIRKSVDSRMHLDQLKRGARESQAMFSRDAFLKHFDRIVKHNS